LGQLHHLQKREICPWPHVIANPDSFSSRESVLPEA
jgi:hypothetical protein